MRVSIVDRRRGLLVVLAIVTMIGPLALFIRATEWPTARLSIARPAPLSPSAIADRPTPGGEGVAVTAPTSQPSPVTTAPAPFVHNFGPPAGPFAPLPSPTAPVAFPVGDGCDHGYGDVNQCVPTRFPPGVADGCAWLKSHGFGPLVVHGEDRLGLDRNRDGIACGPGD